MASQAPKDVKTCYLLQFDSTYSSFMCNWANDVSNHFVYMLEKQEGFYSEDAKHGAYKGRGGILDVRFNPFTVEDDYGVGSSPDLSQKK
jgi:hypothetical protein